MEGNNGSLVIYVHFYSYGLSRCAIAAVIAWAAVITIFGRNKAVY